MSEFTDGSYFHAEINSPQIDFDGDNVNVKWQDKLNAYELTRGVIKIGEVSARNSWTTEQSNAAKIEKLQLPDSMNIIGDDAFSDCYYLISLIIPSSVTDISSSNFPTHRPNLTDIIVLSGNAKYRSVGHCLIDTEAKTLVFGCNNSIIPSDGSVTRIGRGAFRGCSGLKNISIPNSVTSIGDGAFSACDKLIREEKGVKYVDKWAVNSAYGVTSVVLRKNTVGIVDGAFEGRLELINITMPNSVTSIGYAAFYNCSGLTSITIPNSVTSIGSSAFSGCDGLTSITIPNSVTSIGESAFEDCSSLTSITIPNSVTSIRSSTFSGCDKLIQIENGVNYVDKWVINCDGNVTSVTLRDNTVGIGESAFRGCYKLTSITIPNSVTSIGDYAFEDCSGLTSIAIPNGVTSIGNYAFEDCSGLTSIAIPNGVTSIGDYAFEDCSSLTSITIPNSVTSIGNSSFEDCSGLTSITIPNSVMSIGDRAFSWCSWLRSITFNGTKAQWNAISKGNNWNYVTGKYTIHCTDGDIEKSVE